MKRVGGLLLLLLSFSLKAEARTADFSGWSVPSAPAAPSEWDWTKNESFPTYGSPWSPSATNWAVYVGERCLPSDGWVMYDRHMFAGDYQLIQGQILSGAGTLYFILYNKYTGILRLFQFVTKPYENVNSLEAVLRISSKTNSPNNSSGVPMQAGMLNFSEEGGYSQIASYRSSYARSLVSKTPHVGASNSWWVFDFPLTAYDPIGAGEKRYFSIEVRALTASQLSLSGRIAGDLGTVSTGVDRGWLQMPLSFGLEAAKKFAPGYIGTGIDWFAKVLKGVSDENNYGRKIGNLLKENNSEITKESAKLLLEAGVSQIDNYVAERAQVRQVTGFLSAEISLSGTITTSAVAGVPVSGVLEPIFGAGDPEAPVLVKNRGDLDRLGLVAFSKVPKIWVYANEYSTVRDERGVFDGYNATTFTPNRHEFKVQDPWCSGSILVNPGSKLIVRDVQTAVNETNWDGVAKIGTPATDGNFYFYGLRKKVTDFSTDVWVNTWPGTGYLPDYANNRFQKTPILPHVTNLEFPYLDDRTGAWDYLYRYNQAGQRVKIGYHFRERGGRTELGEEYSAIAPLAVSVLVKLTGPAGVRHQMVWTFRANEVEYVASRAAFDAINPGYACAERTAEERRKSAGRLQPAINLLLD